MIVRVYALTLCALYDWMILALLHTKLQPKIKEYVSV